MMEYKCQLISCSLLTYQTVIIIFLLCSKTMLKVSFQSCYICSTINILFRAKPSVKSGRYGRMSAAQNHKRDLQALIEKQRQGREQGHDSGIETEKDYECDHAVEVIGQLWVNVGK